MAVYIANAVFRIVKIMVNKVTFVGFRGSIIPIAPSDPPLDARRLFFHSSKTTTSAEI